MAVPGQFAELGSNILEKIIYGGFWIFGTLILCAIIVGAVLYIKFFIARFNIDVTIRSVRSRGADGSPIYKIIKDKGGFIHSRRDKSRWFRLKGERVDLPVPPLDALEVDYRGRNHVNIVQKSDEEYYYLLPGQINDTVIVRDGQEIPVAEQTMKVVEGDVSYWNQLRKRQNKQIFDIESFAMKMMPYVLIGAMLVGVIFYTYIWMDKSASIAGMTQENLQIIKQVTENMLELTRAQSAVVG